MINIGIILSIVFYLDVLCGIVVIASFPVLCFTPYIRLACCMFGTALASHAVIHWFFDFSIIGAIGEMLREDDEDGEDDE